MDTSISDAEYLPVLQQSAYQQYSSSSPEHLMECTDYAVFDESGHSELQDDQLPQNQFDTEGAELLSDQPGTEYTQYLVTDANGDASDELWSCNLTAEFIEQCVQTLDVINDTSCLAIAEDQPSMAYPGAISVDNQNSSIPEDSLQNHLSLENYETENLQTLEDIQTDDMGLLWLNAGELDALPADADLVQRAYSAPEQPERGYLWADAGETSDTSGSILCAVPPSASVPESTAGVWAEQHQGLLAHRPVDSDAARPELGGPQCSALGDARAAWSLVPVGDVAPRTADTAGWWPTPPPPVAARLAEVECELTVSEETEQEVAPPGGGPTGEQTPYQEHNYDYPLEPLVAGEVRPSADHQYASRPASPAGACSATDHRYAYSPPAALTEEDLIRSISDQLGLPQDHGYSQRHGAAPPPPPLPPPPLPYPDPPAPTVIAESATPRAEPSLVTESCPPDWEPALDEPAGDWVDPNLVMGLAAGWQREEEVGEEVGDDGGTAEAMAELLEGADAVLLDETLWEPGLEVFDEEGSKYLVLDVVEPDPEELHRALSVDGQDLCGNGQRLMLSEEYETLAADMVDSEAGTDLTQLLWTVSSSSLGSETDAPVDDSEPSLVQLSTNSVETETATLTDSVLPTNSVPQGPAEVLTDEPFCAVPSSTSAFRSSPVEAEEPPWVDSAQDPENSLLTSSETPDIPQESKSGSAPVTNIVISRHSACEGEPPPPSEPSRLLEPDPAAMVFGWLKRRAAALRPVTRDELSADLGSLLGLDGRRRLKESDSFLARWLDRLSPAPAGAEDGAEDGGAEQTAAADGKQKRLGYPPVFKLLVLRFTDFMTPDETAAAFRVPLALVYKWRNERPRLAELAARTGGVRARGAGRRRCAREVDAELIRWLEKHEKEAGAPPGYDEVRRAADRLYSRAGLRVPRAPRGPRELGVTSRRRDPAVVRWLLARLESGRAASRAELVEYGLKPGGRDWASRLLARRPALVTPLATWQMALPEQLLVDAERWAGALEVPLPPPRAVAAMVDVPIETRPAPCAVWKPEHSEHLATLLISCTLDGVVLPPMLIMKGGGRRVYSDSSGLLTAEQEEGRLDGARAGLWLQLVGCRCPVQLLVINSCCAHRAEQLRAQATAGGRRLAIIPPGLGAAANPLMPSRQRLMMSVATALREAGSSTHLLPVVRSQLADWSAASDQLHQELAMVARLYSTPPD